MKPKFILTSAISAVILTHSLFAASPCVAFADDNENSYTVVVSNEGWSDDQKSEINFYCDLIWTICGDDISCQSPDNSIHFNAEIRDDTLYVDGTDFLFAIGEIPNMFDEEDESCGAMLDWILKLRAVRNMVFSDSVETLEMLGSTVFFARIENIEFGNSFKRVGENTLGIPSLRNMEFPESLKEIGRAAFRSCRHLEKIVLPSGIEKIGENAFYGCSELKDITILSKDIELSNSGIGYSRSGELLTDVIIHGYSGSTAETYANENNFEFVPLDNEIIGTGQCGEDVYWTLYSDGTLDLEGTGATYDYTFNCSLVSDENEPDTDYDLTSEFGFPTWFDNENREDITTINVGEGITRLGDLIFFNISSRLEQVNLPDSLEEIGYFAFSSFGYLGDITHSINKIPDNLKVIESGSLLGIDFKDKIILPESVEKIGSLAFNTTAKEYVIPQNVKEISPLAFGVIDNEDYVDNDPIYDSFIDDNLEPFWKFIEVAIFRKDCDAVLDMFKPDTDITVYGYTDTAAEAYANENNFEFVPLDEKPVITTTTIEATTSTSAEITSENTSTTSSSTTTTATTTSSSKTDSPKTGDKGIIGVSTAMLSALGMLCITRKKRQ